MDKSQSVKTPPPCWRYLPPNFVRHLCALPRNLSSGDEEFYVNELSWAKILPRIFQVKFLACQFSWTTCEGLDNTAKFFSQIIRHAVFRAIFQLGEKFWPQIFAGTWLFGITQNSVSFCMQTFLPSSTVPSSCPI